MKKKENQVSSFGERAGKLRKEALKHIKKLLKKYGLTEINVEDLGCGCFYPIISENPLDGDLSLCLDSIRLTDNILTFHCSSCFTDCNLTEDDLSPDAVFGVADFLAENEDDLKESSEED